MRAFLTHFAPTSLSRHPEVLLAFGVGGILAMLVVPLPPAILDVLLATNMALGALILVAVLLSEKPLAVSSFPTLLLITTLFRLGLNVSTTRMILGDGTAGEVVKAFGDFVAKGDVVMGLVVFLVLTLVQLMVIGKGAERVAEVGARFTLDAMPGKQMSIDAALRNGACTEEEAEDKRSELGRESQFYGAMDGAMKFVKGDATVGLIVTALNLIAGLAIGILRFDMSVGEAAETFAILTIGDGLVSQIPALLIALASGVLTTRVASKAPKEDLGRVLSEELFASHKVLAIAAVFALVIGLVPGLPLVPFAVIAAALGTAAFVASRGGLAAISGAQPDAQLSTGPRDPGAPAPAIDDGSPEARSFADEMKKRTDMLKAQKALADQMAPAVRMVSVDIEPSLARAMGFGQGADTDTPFQKVWLRDVRNNVFGQLGVHMPPTNTNTNPMPGLPKFGFRIRIKEVPVREGVFDPERVLVMTPPSNLQKLSVPDVEPAECPDGRLGCTVPYALKDALADAGVPTFDVNGFLALHLLEAVKAHLPELFGLEETLKLVEGLSKVYPGLVKELVPRVVTPAMLRDVLRQLLREQIPLRDLKTILEALGEVADASVDLGTLTEHVRAALRLHITHTFTGGTRTLGAVVIDDAIEDLVRDAVMQGPRGAYLALEPELADEVVAAVERTFRSIDRAGRPRVLVARGDVRLFLHMLLAPRTQRPVAVLAYDEIDPDVRVQPLGKIRIGEEPPALAA